MQLSQPKQEEATYVEVQDSRSLAGDTVVGVLDQVGLDFHLIGRRQSQVIVGQAILGGLGDLLTTPYLSHKHNHVNKLHKNTYGKTEGIERQVKGLVSKQNRET